MVNLLLLRKYIDDSGYKLTFLAKKLNITYQAFLKKLNGETEFKASELYILCDLLKIGIQKIFLT